MFMNSFNIKQKVIDIITEVCMVNTAAITDEADLQEDLGIDSVDIVSLILALEDEFGGTISNEEVENLKTVEDVIAHIELKLSEAK